MEKRNMLKKLVATAIAMMMMTPIVMADGWPGHSKHINQELALNGLNVYIQGSTTEAWWYETTIDGKDYRYFQEKRSDGSFSVSLDQGFMGRNYRPLDNTVEIRRWDDHGNFQISGGFRFLFSEEDTWADPPSGHMYWNAFGIEYNTNIETQHNWDWDYDKEEIQKNNNVLGRMSVLFEDSEIENVSFSVQDFTY
jgi:hypothetical protein